jgi:GTP-binding protein HflX
MQYTRERFILLKVIDPQCQEERAVREMAELAQLVETFGGELIEEALQHRPHPDPATYIGSGKVAWLKEVVAARDISVVVLNDVVNSGQLFRLEKALWEVNTTIKVWDRVDLILAIFRQHASTAEAQLQIELAQLQHTGPRFYGLGKTELSRQGGGIGTRGKGETNIEIERRHLKKRVQTIKAELVRRGALRARRIALRQERGVKTVALVGYTSAGKTTLFNALTSKTKKAHQGLFTTLDSTLGKLDPRLFPQRILVSDTIGFIEELPPVLIDAFHSTLLESIEADLLVHVVDVSDPHWEQKVASVEQILLDLGITTLPLIVANKIDAASPELLAAARAFFAERESVFLSARTEKGLSQLRERIALLDPAFSPIASPTPAL